MDYEKNLPWIISPCSINNVGGIGSWTKSMYAYAEKLKPHNLYYIHHYANNLKSITNVGLLSRIITGILLYLKLSLSVFIIIQRYRPSVLHVTSSASIGLVKDILIIWLCKLTKTPVVLHWRFGRIPELASANNWEWRLLKYVIQNSKYSMVIDEKSYNKLKNQGFSNIVNVPNPISLDIEYRSKVNIMPYSERIKGRVLFVGHVIRNKGVFELVRACAEIPAVEELLLVGPFDENIKNQLLDIAKKRENGTWLKLKGQKNKNQVLSYMENSQLLILPSYTEGFPNVVLEAMAMGCPVIASDVGAIPEMIDFRSNKPCGLCVPAHNVEKLKDAIIYLVKNTVTRENMGRLGMEKILNNYTIEKVVAQYIEIWNNASQ